MVKWCSKTCRVKAASLVNELLPCCAASGACPWCWSSGLLTVLRVYAHCWSQLKNWRTRSLYSFHGWLYHRNTEVEGEHFLCWLCLVQFTPQFTLTKSLTRALHLHRTLWASGGTSSNDPLAPSTERLSNRSLQCIFATTLRDPVIVPNPFVQFSNPYPNSVQEASSLTFWPLRNVLAKYYGGNQ